MCMDFVLEDLARYETSEDQNTLQSLSAWLHLKVFVFKEAFVEKTHFIFIPYHILPSDYLGISVKLSSSKVRAIQNRKTGMSIEKLKSLIGMNNLVKSFCKFAKTSRPGGL